MHTRWLDVVAHGKLSAGHGSRIIADRDRHCLRVGAAGQERELFDPENTLVISGAAMESWSLGV